MRSQCLSALVQLRSPRTSAHAVYAYSCYTPVCVAKIRSIGDGKWSRQAGAGVTYLSGVSPCSWVPSQAQLPAALCRWGSAGARKTAHASLGHCPFSLRLRPQEELILTVRALAFAGLFTSIRLSRPDLDSRSEATSWSGGEGSEHSCARRGVPCSPSPLTSPP